MGDIAVAIKAVKALRTVENGRGALDEGLSSSTGWIPAST
jgi:hypothetical protein